MNRLNESSKLVDAFGVFTFDLNAGQSCEFVFPSDFLGTDDLKAISMLSFPDSQSITQNQAFDCVYSFSYKIRTPHVALGGSSACKANCEKPEELQCYVYFRQMEDQSNARGFYQKSFVLISSSSATFKNADDLISLVRRIGNKFYLAEESGCGREVLMDAYTHVEVNGFIRMSSASSSDFGASLTSLSTRSLELSGSPLSPSNSAFAQESIYLLIEGLWHLWEGLLVGLPILVYCPARADLCSRVVLAMTSLISPIEFVGDIRPFLSIFDPDYNYFKGSSGSLGPCIVGVTSPMAFQQLSSSFSIFLVLSSNIEEGISDGLVEVAKSERGRMYLSESITSVSSGTRTRVSSLAARFSLLSSGQTESGYRLVIPSDVDSVCNKFVSSSDGINRAIITRHFALLTRDFLMPFVEYVETDSSILSSDLLCETQSGKLFVPGAFLSGLCVGVGRHLASVSSEKLRNMYAAFIGTTSFKQWLGEQQQYAIRESYIAHAELILKRLTEDKIMWMSANEKSRGRFRISELKKQLEVKIGGSRAASLSERLHRIDEMLSSDQL